MSLTTIDIDGAIASRRANTQVTVATRIRQLSHNFRHFIRIRDVELMRHATLITVHPSTAVNIIHGHRIVDAAKHEGLTHTTTLPVDFLPASKGQIKTKGVSNSARYATQVRIATLNGDTHGNMNSQRVRYMNIADDLNQLTSYHATFRVPYRLNDGNVITFLSISNIQRDGNSTHIRNLQRVVTNFRDPISRLTLNTAVITPVTRVPAIKLTFLDEVIRFSNTILASNRQRPGVNKVNFAKVPAIAGMSRIAFLLICYRRADQLQARYNTTNVTRKRRAVHTFQRIIMPHILISVILFRTANPISRRKINNMMNLLIQNPTNYAEYSSIMAPIVLRCNEDFRQAVLFSSLRVFTARQNVHDEIYGGM